MSFSSKKRTKRNAGFTLIELMTAISIFIIIMTISMGSILGVFEANRKSRSLKTVFTNLNLVIESMSKEMRFGTGYHCGTGDLDEPADCPAGESQMGFLSNENVPIVYRLNGGSIEKQIGEGDFIAVTAPEIVIDEMVFYVLGTDSDDELQPKVLMKVRSHAGEGTSRSDLTLQTLVSQRNLDI